MSEEPRPQRKIPPAAMIGAAVAIGAGLLTVFATSRNDTARQASPPAQAASAEPGDDQTAQIQFGQNGQTTPPAVPATPDPTAPIANADGSLAYSDAFISFSAAIPPGPATDPVLTYLRTDALAYFSKYKTNARTDADDRKQQGAPAMPWEVAIEWKYTAKAGDLVSLVGTAYEFTGGAHGMTYMDTHIAKAATGEQIAFASMMNAGAISPALTIGICEALKAAKIQRGDTANVLGEPIACAGFNANIEIEQAKIALAPSTEPDKFGGVFVYYDPYVVGAYAEGTYSLKVPHEVFAEDLRPEYKSMFGGKLTGEP